MDEIQDWQISSKSYCNRSDHCDELKKVINRRPYHLAGLATLLINVVLNGGFSNPSTIAVISNIEEALVVVVPMPHALGN